MTLDFEVTADSGDRLHAWRVCPPETRMLLALRLVRGPSSSSPRRSAARQPSPCRSLPALQIAQRPPLRGGILLPSALPFLCCDPLPRPNGQIADWFPTETKKRATGRRTTWRFRK